MIVDIVLEIVQTLSEAEKRQIKVTVMPEEIAEPKDNSQSEDGYSQPDIFSCAPMAHIG